MPTGDPAGNIVYNVTNDTLSITAGSNYSPLVVNATGQLQIGGYQTCGSTLTTSSSGTIWADATPSDELKSKPTTPADEHAHDIECRLRLESNKVISQFYCKHCEEVLFSKVISEIPKSIIDKKCLARIVKGV